MADQTQPKQFEGRHAGLRDRLVKLKKASAARDQTFAELEDRLAKLELKTHRNDASVRRHRRYGACPGERPAAEVATPASGAIMTPGQPIEQSRRNKEKLMQSLKKQETIGMVEKLLMKRLMGRLTRRLVGRLMARLMGSTRRALRLAKRPRRA